MKYYFNVGSICLIDLIFVSLKHSYYWGDIFWGDMFEGDVFWGDVFWGDIFWGNILSVCRLLQRPAKCQRVQILMLNFCLLCIYIYMCVCVGSYTHFCKRCNIIVSITNIVQLRKIVTEQYGIVWGMVVKKFRGKINASFCGLFRWPHVKKCQ